MPPEHRASRGGTPIFEFARLLEDQFQEWPSEIGVPTLLVVLSRFLHFLARNSLAAQDNRDRILVVDRRFKRERLAERIGFLVEHQRSFRRLR